jgi:hypothetical protein
MKNKTYYTVGTFLKYNRKVKNKTYLWYVLFFIFLLDFRNVPTVWYALFYIFLLDFRNVPTVWNALFFIFSVRFLKYSDSVVCFVFHFSFLKSRKTKHTTLSEHLSNLEKQNIPHCRNISKI